MQRVGSRTQVMNGNAKQTSGGLTKGQLKRNKSGKIVSIKASNRAKKENRLVKAGYKTTSGQFKLFRRSSRRNSQRKSARRSKRR